MTDKRRIILLVLSRKASLFHCTVQRSMLNILRWFHYTTYVYLHENAKFVLQKYVTSLHVYRKLIFYILDNLNAWYSMGLPWPANRPGLCTKQNKSINLSKLETIYFFTAVITLLIPRYNCMLNIRNLASVWKNKNVSLLNCCVAFWRYNR